MPGSVAAAVSVERNRTGQGDARINSQGRLNTAPLHTGRRHLLAQAEEAPALRRDM